MENARIVKGDKFSPDLPVMDRKPHMTTIGCWKSWAPSGGKPRGQCCCNCKSHMSLFSHPWVDGKPISHQVGWVCVEGFDKRVATLNNKHGLCEMHEPRDKKAVAKQKVALWFHSPRKLSSRLRDGSAS